MRQHKEQLGGPCRWCGGQVEKREARKKRRPFETGQTYWFRWYFICLSCKKIYHDERAKQIITPEVRRQRGEQQTLPGL